MLRSLDRIEAVPRRKSPVHFDGEPRLSQMPVQFVTVCTKARRPILANERAHQALLGAWRLADAWLVGKYVLMPDHVHLFCAPATFEPPPLGKWIAYWKSMSARQFPKDVPRPVWQDDYWDRALRKNESYAHKWQYVLENPVRAGLVSKAESWPYAGEIVALTLR